MSMSTRSQVLSAFRELHRVRRIVFKGDIKALTVTREKINEEFKKNKANTDPKFLEEQLKLAKDVAQLMLTELMQFSRKPNSSTYVAHVRKDLLKSD